jgi:hypothetical protein
MRNVGWLRAPSRAVGFAIVMLMASSALALAQSRLVPSAAIETESPPRSNDRSASAMKANTAASKAQKQTQQRAEKKRLSLIQQRKRAALQQRLLLQDKDLREKTDTSQRQLNRVRDQQAESLRLQQEQQRRVMVQQRRLQQPQQPGSVPRLTPYLDRPLIEQRNPSCGVAGMPLC